MTTTDRTGAEPSGTSRPDRPLPPGPARAAAASTDGTEPAPTGSRRRTAAWPLDVAAYGAAALISTVLTTWALRLWEATWSVPFVHIGDAVAVQAHAKTVIGTGWYEREPALGAPAGQVYHDFPTAENLHMVAFRLLGLVVPDSATAVNVYYVVGFPLAALVGLWFLRLCGISRTFAVVLAVLFALSPYHFERHQGHLFLASYWTIPLALGVVVTVLQGRPVWGRSRRLRGGIAWVTGPGAMTVVAMVVLGTSSTYYSVFVALLLAAAGLLALVRDGHSGRFLGAAGAGVVLVATMVANMAPDLLFARSRDANVLALTRFPEEAEIYALKLVQLVLPSDRHRFAPLRQLREYYNRTFPLPSESPTLGAVAAVGLLMLLVVVTVAVVRPARARAADGADTAAPGQQAMRWRTLTHLSLLSLVALLAATVGGLSSLMAVLVTDNLRGWARMTIVIALLALAGVGVLADLSLGAVLRKRHRLRSAAAGILAVGLLAVGVVDQTSPEYVPGYATNAEIWTSDEDYVAALEASQPAGAMVYQLPYIPFPEAGPTNGVQGTDQLRMFLHSTDLRWSSGGIRGRPTTDWAGLVASRPVPVLVDQLAVAGFAGVHVDRFAYPDAGRSLESELTGLLGGPLHTSPDLRYAFWSLTPAAERLEAELPAPRRAELRTAVLEPVVAYTVPDFTGPAQVGETLVWNSATATPELFLDNPRDETVVVDLSFELRSASGIPAAEVELPGSAEPQVVTIDGQASVSARLELPPGRSTIRIAPVSALVDSGAVDPVSARFELVDLVVSDPVLAGLAP